jgi:hypothetical protein
MRSPTMILLVALLSTGCRMNICHCDDSYSPWEDTSSSPGVGISPRAALMFVPLVFYAVTIALSPKLAGTPAPKAPAQ